MRPRRGIFYVGAEQHIASAGGGGIIQYNIIIIIRRNISAFLFNQKVLIHFFFFFSFPRKGAVAVHYTECIQRSTNGNGTHSYPQLDLMPILNNTNRSMRMDWIKSLASRWSVRWISFEMTTLSIGLSKIWRRGINYYSQEILSQNVIKVTPREAISLLRPFVPPPRVIKHIDGVSEGRD